MRWEGHATTHCEVVDPPPLDLAPRLDSRRPPIRIERGDAEGRAARRRVEGSEVAGLLAPGGAGGGGGWMAEARRRL